MLGLSFNHKTKMFYFHYIEWNDNKHGYATLIEAMKTLKIPMAFIRAMFDREVVVTYISDAHVRFLNQLSGPSLPPWMHSPAIAKRNILYFHEMISAPNLWSSSWVKHLKRPNLIAGPTCPCGISNVVYSKHASDLARLTKTKRLIQFEDSKTMVFYTRKRNCSRRFGEYKFQPMTLSRHGYQYFALLPESKVCNLEGMFVTNGLMDPEDYQIELEDIVMQCGSEIVTYPILACGHTYCGHTVHTFIIVCMDYQCNPESIGASQFGMSTWIKFIDMNVNDCNVPGCVGILIPVP